MIKKIEQGDLYFFYRKKMDVEKTKSIDDIQRVHMLMAPDLKEKKRLFIIGKKKLPEIIKGKRKSTQREWALNVLTSKKNDSIKEALSPTQYMTKTKGQRVEPGAVPLAQGRYQIFEHENHTSLGYKIQLPKKIGKAQKEFGLKNEAEYILSVKNPEIKMRGFSQMQPKYPKSLKDKFSDKRWIDVQDTRLLDYEDVQALLIGARDDLSDIKLKITGKANMFKKLDMNKNLWPTKTLEKGLFTDVEHKKEPVKPEKNRTLGGQRGGKKALKTASAAGITRALRGSEFPIKKNELIKRAKENNSDEKIIKTLKELESKEYKSMKDVQKEVGKVR